jgi:hypothetical protein
MKFKLLDYAIYEDFGNEWFLQIFSYYPLFAAVDIHAQWDDYPAPEIFPFLIFSIGARSLCGFSFRWKWFEIRVDFIKSRPRNLQGYRNRMWLRGDT